jgi:tryptophan-rich sensory protein
MSWWTLLPFVVAVFAAASTGAIFKPGDWYRGLRKPFFTPADWVFPVAWSVMYTMIAVSGWLVWETAAPDAWLWPMLVFGLHLILNAAWSWIFFGLRRIDWAMAEVAALWLSLVAMIVVFWPINPLAGALLLPYLAWASFAGVLNTAILRMNPEAYGRTPVASAGRP